MCNRQEGGNAGPSCVILISLCAADLTHNLNTLIKLVWLLRRHALVVYMEPHSSARSVLE
jgi:hypothetical protein